MKYTTKTRTNDIKVGKIRSKIDIWSMFSLNIKRTKKIKKKKG